MCKPLFALGTRDGCDANVLLRILLLAPSCGVEARFLSLASCGPTQLRETSSIDTRMRSRIRTVAAALLITGIYGCGGDEASAEEDIAAAPPPNTQPVSCSTTSPVCR